MLDDDGKLKKRYTNKRVNAAKEGLSFELTFSQFCELMRRRGISSSELGVRGYQLSRKGDTGGYFWGNCRFLTYKQNAREKSKRLGHKVGGTKTTPWEVHAARRAEQAAATKRERFENAHPSYKGERNSQYGSYWATNGLENLKWSPSKGELPRGFRKGRV